MKRLATAIAVAGLIGTPAFAADIALKAPRLHPRPSITGPAGTLALVGFGTEGKLLIPGWTLKSEALYVDLGTLDVTGPSVSATSGSWPLGNGIFTTNRLTPGVTTHSHFTDGILRIGLNINSTDLITACAIAPAAWRCLPRSAVPHCGSITLQEIDGRHLPGNR